MDTIQANSWGGGEGGGGVSRKWPILVGLIVKMQICYQHFYNSVNQKTPTESELLL